MRQERDRRPRTPQEFLNKRNTTIRVRLGQTVAFEKLERSGYDLGVGRAEVP